MGQAFTEAVMIRAASAMAKSLKRKSAQGDKAAVFLFIIFFRLWLIESVEVNRFVMFCPEVVVYPFVCRMVDVYVEGVGYCCFFEEIARDE
jgi:hypothetical protein